jgi:hypothetical protein
MQVGEKVKISTGGTITAMGLEGTEQKLIYRIKTDKGNLCFVEQDEVILNIVQEGDNCAITTNG